MDSMFNKWISAMVVSAALSLLLMWGAGHAEDGKQLALVVADFTEVGAEPGTGAAVAENLRTILAGTGRFTVIDRTRTTDILKEQKLALSELASTDGAARLGKFATSDLVIVGSVVKTGKSYSLAARMVLPDTAVVLGSASAESPNADGLNQAVRKLATDLGDAATVAKAQLEGDANLLFADDFYLRANARWQPIVPGAYYVEDGLLHVGDSNPGNGQLCRALVGVPLPEQNVIFSGRMRLLSDPNQAGGMVIGVGVGSEMSKPSKLKFPAPDKGVAAGGGGGIFLIVRANGEYGLAEVDGKSNRLPHFRARNRLAVNSGHSFRLEAANNGVDLFIDDAPAGSLRGVSINGNSVAVGTFGRAEAAFTNIRVEKY
jgi:hypothetical protein